MTPRDNAERRFSEDIERLVHGDEPLAEYADADYMEAVQFARRLLELRQEPDAEFAGRLRRDLLTGLAAQDALAHDSRSWVERLFSRPGLRMAMVSTFVVLAAVGLVWRAGLLSPVAPQAGVSAPDMFAVPAPSVPEATGPAMARAPDDTATKEDAEPPMLATSTSSIVVVGHVAPTAALGEDISITVVFRNAGPGEYSLAPFPPAVTIREAGTGRVVRTFDPGTASYAISGMEIIRFDIVWNQEDSGGAQVEPGRYEVDVETIEARLQEGELTVSVGAGGIAAFDIL